jgi:hypothetical protein
MASEETPQVIAVDEPNYAIVINQDSAGKHWLGIHVQTTSMQGVFFLCRADTYEEVAREFHAKIMDAGRQARRADIGLVIVDGDKANAISREAKRGQQPRPRPARPARPRPSAG